jgi:peptidyl-prolyl cis-trans isomerase D
MFDFIDKHKKLIQIAFLILIVPPFALFGVDAYFRGMEGGQAVARVGDYVITQEEFARMLRERQQSIQRTVQGRIDPEMLDNPELRQATLESMIQRRLLIDQALKSGITVSDSQLQSTIGGLATFRDQAGNFSSELYQQFLRNEGLTPATFEARIRQDMMLQQFSSGYAENGFAPRTVVAQLARLTGQQREVSHAVLAPDSYLASVKLGPEAAKQYYDANTAEFRIPEQVRVEYVTLSVDSLMEGMQADPDEVKKYYDANRNQFGAEESRQAAHILLSVEAGADAEAKQKARARADVIYGELQKNPADFAAAAKKHSQDPGSAAQGGDLGRITRGAMKDIPEFESALFQLKPGGISPPVETRHGFHIIRAVSVEPAQVKPFEEVRGQIEKELNKQLAARRFAELAEGFTNTAYEQSDSLKPAAELVKAQPRSSGWITRSSAGAPLNNPRLLNAIFSDEVLKDRRNTEAIEAGPGLLVAARVIEHKPSSIQPFEEVRGGLEKKLALREATRLAVEEGRRQLEALRQGKPATVAWSAPLLVSREGAKDLPEPVLRQAFRMDASKLPAYAGVDGPRAAYVLLRVTRVQEAGDIPPERLKSISDQLRQVLGEEALSAHLASLKQKAGVTINKEQLEKKQ